MGIFLIGLVFAMMLCVIDYGMGNLNSVAKALWKLQLPYFVSPRPEDTAKATHLILPGVGFFAEGMKNLQKRGWITILQQELLTNHKPLLGICLGMQLLFDSSEEGGEKVPGLGFIKGKIIRFRCKDPHYKIPHVGWNDVFGGKDASLLKGIEDYTDFYFVHSYHAVPEENIVCAYTNYEYDFVSLVQKHNICGAQFHPEKSQKKGFQLLENFVRGNYA